MAEQENYALERTRGNTYALSAPAQVTQTDPFAVAKMMAQSGYFDDAQEAAQAFVKIIAAREVGLGDIAGMTGIHVIKGKVTHGSNVLATLVQRSGRFSYEIKELNEDKCWLIFYEHDTSGNRNALGDSTFTKEDAQKAQTGKAIGGMTKYARNMLFARAMSNGVKWYCPSITGGGPIYTPDELGVDVDEDGQVVGETSKKPEPDPATKGQVELIGKMSKSHVLTKTEKDRLAFKLRTGFTKDEAKSAIDWLKMSIEDRKKIEEEEKEQAVDISEAPQTSDGAIEAEASLFPEKGLSGLPQQEETPASGDTAILGGGSEKVIQKDITNLMLHYQANNITKDDVQAHMKRMWGVEDYRQLTKDQARGIIAYIDIQVKNREKFNAEEV